MKIPLEITCQACGAIAIAQVALGANSTDWLCECGQSNSVHLGAEFTVGWRILLRSQYELYSHEDYSMCIVFAAMSFESELSHLFFKWQGVAALERNAQIDDAALEDMLRTHKTIREKIERVARLMDARGIDEFVRNSPRLCEHIDRRFPELHVGTLAEDFQKTLFWPRNRILHAGCTNYSAEDAERCRRIASLGLILLFELDHARRATP